MERALMTQKMMAESLKKIASEKLFEQVTVKDIVEECQVNRQTFYYHFTDKYELLDWIYYSELFEPLTREISFDNWDERFGEMFRTMKENKQFYRNTIRCSDNLFQEYLLKMLTTLFSTAVQDLNIFGGLSLKKKQIYAKVFAYGLSGAITEWAENGMKEDGDEMAKIMKEMVDSSEKFASQIYQYKKETGDSSLSGMSTKKLK